MIVSNPNRPLDKGVEMTRFEFFCNKIVPYVIVACIIVLMILVVVVLVKYGANLTGTEANQYYYQMERI